MFGTYHISCTKSMMLSQSPLAGLAGGMVALPFFIVYGFRRKPCQVGKLVGSEMNEVVNKVAQHHGIG